MFDQKLRVLLGFDRSECKAKTALTWSSSNNMSRSVIRLGLSFAGPYDDKVHIGLSTPGLKSFAMVSSLLGSLGS